MKPPPPLVYKIFRITEWDAFQKSGTFTGSPDDEHDGFIHLSCLDQVDGTLRAHFGNEREVVIAEVRTDGLPIAMEVSRGRTLFPHLYGSLPLSSVEHSERRGLPID